MMPVVRMVYNHASFRNGFGVTQLRQSCTVSRPGWQYDRGTLNIFQLRLYFCLKKKPVNKQVFQQSIRVPIGKLHH